MEAQFSDIAKQGYVRIKSKKLGVWQRRWLILRRASSKGQCRLEKYLDEKSAKSIVNDVHYKEIYIDGNVSRIDKLASEHKKSGIAIQFHSGETKCFSCENESETNDWLNTLEIEWLTSSSVPEKPLLDKFHVYLLPTCNLDWYGECMMQVTQEKLYLWDRDSPRLKLVTWPIIALKRYGWDCIKFSFEAGRWCETGEGIFMFNTKQGKEIYSKLHSAAVNIADQHKALLFKDGKERLDKLIHSNKYCRSTDVSPSGTDEDSESSWASDSISRDKDDWAVINDPSWTSQDQNCNGDWTETSDVTTAEKDVDDEVCFDTLTPQFKNYLASKMSDMAISTNLMECERL